jgi:peptide/nickel transport system permease protein
MLGYLLGRIAATIPVLVLISLLVFLLIHAAPGDPADLLLSDEASPADIAEARRRWGLDQPIYVQYLRFLANIASGDLGISFRYSDPVLDLIRQRLPATIELAIASLLIALVFGIPLGVWAGAKPNSWADNLGSMFGFFGISMPSFWLGIMLILFVSVRLGWLPASGYVSPAEDFARSMQTMIMPAFVLGTGLAATLTRHSRSAMLSVLSSDYVRTARAKGLRERTVILKHALRNALTPIVTISALLFGELVGGAVLTEQIFTIPGFGKLVVDAVFTRDYAVVQGIVLCTGIGFIAMNLLADTAYLVLNPRARDA